MVATCSNQNSLGPDQPMNFMVTSRGQTSLTFSWLAPVETDTAPLTHYTLDCDPVQPLGIPDPGPVMVNVPDTTGTVTNLSPGVMYNCEVTATNDAGVKGSPAGTDATTLEIGLLNWYILINALYSTCTMSLMAFKYVLSTLAIIILCLLVLW